MGYHKIGIVQILIEDRLGKNGSGEAAGDEEGDETEGEEHGCGVDGAGAP